MQKEDFIDSTYQNSITQTLDNLGWGDIISYSWPTFLEWLKLHEISSKDIELIRDEYIPEEIKTEHAGSYYPVSNEQFILLIEEESEETIGDWYTKQELEWIAEEHTVSGDYFYIYNPTAYYITIELINTWLKENKEN